jgi:L,D-transpeptidase YcbB
MNRIFAPLVLILFVAALLTGCQASPSLSRERQESQPDTLTPFRLGVLQSYLDSLDVPAPASVDSLFSTLYRLRYGRPPRHLSHLALSEHTDSILIQNEIKKFLDPKTTDFLAGIRALEPRAMPYIALKKHYYRLRREEKTDSLTTVYEALNAFRWMQRFTDSTYLLINLAAAELMVIEEGGSEALRMRTIVGSRSHQTPAFATHITEIVTYPYWNVPRSIAINEILPKVKQDAGYLTRNNMQVISANGRVVDPGQLNWASFGGANFPYRFRQSTGCDNALGLVKFNLESPYAIYLHDTNARSLFGRANRWLSHGCIRLQRPTELANILLNEPIFDEEYLNKCLIGAKPGSIRLSGPVPVFILYLPADVDETGALRWHRNVYGWR